MIVARLLRQAVGFQARSICHVGAHVGQELEEYEALGAELVIWIEADPELFLELQAQVRSRARGATTHLCLNALIADQDGHEMTLRQFSNAGASSSIYAATDLLRQAFPGVTETGTVRSIVSTRLDTLLAHIGLAPDRLDVLVLDVQGAELLCLRGAGVFLSEVKFLEVEVSQGQIYADAPLFPELDSYVRAAGFTRISAVPWHGDVVYANSRFVATVG